MATDRYTLEVLAEIDRYVEGVKKIPGVTEQQVAKAALAFEKRWAKAQADTAKKARAASEEAAEGWDSFAGRADRVGGAAAKVRGVLDQLSPSAGAAAGLVNDLGDALTVMASPAGVVVGVLTAGAAAGALFTAGIVKAVFASDEALERLEGFKRIKSDFYPAIPDSTLSSIEAVNASSDALSSIWSKLVVQGGSALAPTLERVTNVAVGLALRAGEVGRYFGIAVATGKAFGQVLAGQVAFGLHTVLVPLTGVVGGMIALADFAGVDVPDALRQTSEQLADLTRRTGQAGAGLWDQALAGTALDDVLGDLERSGAAFVADQQRATKAMAAGKRETWDLVAALTKLEEQERKAQQARLTGAGAIRAQRDAELAAIDEAASHEAAAGVARGATWDQLAQLFAAAEKTKAAVVEDAERRIQALRAETTAKTIAGLEEAKLKHLETVRTATAAAIEADNAVRAEAAATQAQTLQVFGQGVDAIGQLTAMAAAQAAEQGKGSARELFQISQASALINATMSAWQAAAAAGEWGAKVGGPAGAAAATLLTFGLLEGLAVAQIKSQEPPSFGDTPDLMFTPTGGLIQLAPGDYFAAATEPARVADQADTTPRARSTRPPPIHIDLRVTGRTAQRMVQLGGAEPTRGGRPTLGHRSR